MAASEQVEIIGVYAGPDRRSDGNNDDYVRIALRALEKRDKPVHSAYRRPSLYDLFSKRRGHKRVTLQSVWQPRRYTLRLDSPHPRFEAR